MEVSVTYKIDCNLTTVYQAIVDKNKINKYFVTSASDDLDKSEKILWKWDDYSAQAYVYNIEIIENKSIFFTWKANNEERLVKIILSKLPDNKTQISISEGPFAQGENQVQNMLQQNQGWTDFICSLKAYLYAGINLRK